MSSWTYVNGTINVTPMGRTQAEKRYILDTVLNHLPQVTGSEGDMEIHIIQKSGHNISSSRDEYGDKTNNLIDRYNNKNRKGGWLNLQDEYILVVNGSLRDRELNDTVQEFNQFIWRLAKRIEVEDALVKICGYDKEKIITNKNDVLRNMFRDPSWMDKDSTNWCEHLMWKDDNK